MNYAQLNLFDIANGVGIRVSLFVSGCKFYCDGCFNPDAQDFNCGRKFTEKEETIVLDRLKNKDFSGLSILGGDPLCQSEDDLLQIMQLCNRVHELGKDVWLWTGYTWEEIMSDEMLKLTAQHCDYLIDGRFEIDKKDLSMPWRGSSNQRIINVPKSFECGEIVECDFE